MGRKRRSWTGGGSTHHDPRQEPPRPQPPRREPPRPEPPTHGFQAQDEDLRRTQPVRRNPPHAPQRQWRDVPPPPRPPRPPTRRLEADELPPNLETYGDVDPGYRPAGPPPYPGGRQPPGPGAPGVPGGPGAPGAPGAQQPSYPKKLTVTRVAAIRSRQLTSQAVQAFRRATKADGADKSGLTELTYATMLNYASDAAMAVALANVLFFSPASEDSSRGKVLLYLVITVAPFALIAPVIGPMLDRIQRGRRLAMCVSAIGQALMCVLMATNFDTWLLYPGALGKMVLSKSFTVLKAAVTPRVLPPEITLAKTNARLTVFGLSAGLVGGGIAALFAKIFNSPGALWLTVIICLVGAVQAMRIPPWVEVTEGEVPATVVAHPDQPRRQPMGRHVVTALVGNATIRVLTGFLMMFAAFAVRAQHEGAAFTQLALLGLIAAGAGIGSFAGNGIGARITMGHPETLVIGCVLATLTSTLVATVAPGVGTATLVALVGAMASALAKNSLDAVIQDDLPEESRASAFGRSETALQLTWVFGGAIGLLLPPTYWIGFLVVSIFLAIGLAQTVLSRQGLTLIPGIGGNRPIYPRRTAVP